MVTAYISGTLEIGNYAFDQCLNLEAAEVGAETGTLGLRPFSGCEKTGRCEFLKTARILKQKMG